MQLLRSSRHQLLGLVLLRISSEELLSSRYGLSSERKDELTRLFQIHIPRVFPVLVNLLDSLGNTKGYLLEVAWMENVYVYLCCLGSLFVGNKPRHKATATPPPSPTQPIAPPNFAQQIEAASFRFDTKDVVRELLTTIQHLFSWSQLAEIPVQVIGVIFNFTHVSNYSQVHLGAVSMLFSQFVFA